MTLYQLIEIILAITFFVYIVKRDKKYHPTVKKNKKKDYHAITGGKGIKYIDPNKKYKKKSKNPFKKKYKIADKKSDYIQCCWDEIEKENGMKK